LLKRLVTSACSIVTAIFSVVCSLRLSVISIAVSGVIALSALKFAVADKVWSDVCADDFSYQTKIAVSNKISK